MVSWAALGREFQQVREVDLPLYPALVRCIWSAVSRSGLLSAGGALCCWNGSSRGL